MSYTWALLFLPAETSRASPRTDADELFAAASAAQPPRMTSTKLGQGPSAWGPSRPTSTTAQPKPSLEVPQPLLSGRSNGEDDKGVINVQNVGVVAETGDYYMEYKHNFVSARRLFESGLREGESEAKQASSRPCVGSSVPPKPVISSHHARSEGRHQELGGPPSVPSERSSLHVLAAEYGRHPPRSAITSTSVHEYVKSEWVGHREPLRRTNATEDGSRLKDHGCQTEELNDSRAHTRAYLVHQGCQISQEEVDQTWTHESGFLHDQEIQVSQEDLVNPLKRVASKRTRQYDLVEMPKLKRRIYRRRHGSSMLDKWSLCASDGQELQQEMSVSVSETSQETPCDQGWSRDTRMSVAKSGKFGIANSSSLVASLMDLAWSLPSAYPDVRHNPLYFDDLADLDPDVFQHFPQGEVRPQRPRGS